MKVTDEALQEAVFAVNGAKQELQHAIDHEREAFSRRVKAETALTNAQKKLGKLLASRELIGGDFELRQVGGAGGG